MEINIAYMRDSEVIEIKVLVRVLLVYLYIFNIDYYVFIIENL